jgi:transcriptional regulator with XRE-family HTH domain
MRDRAVEAMKHILATDKKVTERKIFAKRIGTTPNRINSWEYKHGWPVNEVLIKICLEFGISGDWLLTGAGDMKVKNRSEVSMAEVAADIKAIKKKLKIK